MFRSRAIPSILPRRAAARLAAWVLVAIGALTVSGSPSWALAQAQVPTPPSLTSPRGSAPKAVAVASKPAPSPTRPSWTDLTAPQQQALAPLAPGWATMSEGQKRKWLALSQNYVKLPAPEQAKMHSRMTEWVALSPQQRTQARLNFAETKSLTPDDKKAKWEAYKALSPEEKSKLAATAATKKTPVAAAAVKPVAAQKLANVPKPGPDAKSPRIAAGPHPDATGVQLQTSAPAQPH